MRLYMSFSTSVWIRLCVFVLSQKSPTWIIFVVAGIISAVMTGHSASPTVISNYGILNWAVHGKTVL